MCLHLVLIYTFQNPDVVLVHYLNVPYPDDNKMLIANSVNLWAEKKEWTKEELICQLKPMCKSEYLFPFSLQTILIFRILLKLY